MPVRFGASCAALVVAAAPLASAHHEILAKFDDKKPMTLTGVVTLVDWRNPHVHVFVNVSRRRTATRQLGDRAREPDRSRAKRLDAATRCSPATRSRSRASPRATAAARRGASPSSSPATGREGVQRSTSTPPPLPLQAASDAALAGRPAAARRASPAARRATGRFRARRRWSKTASTRRWTRGDC